MELSVDFSDNLTMMPEKFNSEKFSVFFDKVKFELSQVESDFLQLEKEYFKLTPLFERLASRIQSISRVCSENDAALLNFRIKNLYRDLMVFYKSSGYNAEAFHQLFETLRNINNRLPDEVFSESALNIIREKIRNETRKWLPDGISARSEMKKFIALQDEDTRFIIPIRKKVWEKRVQYRRRLKIQIKSIPGENIFTFEPLITLPPFAKSGPKLALLLEMENGGHNGLLIDRIEGVMVFSQKFLNRHINYFPVGEGNYRPYIELKGERYFMRNPAEKLSVGSYRRNP